MLQYAHFLKPTAPQWHSKQLFENRPPRPWDPRSPLPNIIDLETFAEVHLRADDRIKDYLEFPRRNYSSVACRDAIYELQKANAHALYANNAYSRIAFAEIVLKHILAHPGLGYGPRCFVTITPARFAFSTEDRGVSGRELRSVRRCMSAAANFRIRILQNTAREALDPLPFIGMVEIALFPHWSASGWAIFDSVSWHCHLLVWGATGEELYRLLRPLRKRHASIKEGVTSVHIQEVPDDDIARQLIYALKGPQKIYRTAFLRTGAIDLGLEGFDTRAWRIKKDWLRTGQRVRLLDLMSPRTLDELLFGRGEGTDLCRAIRDEALAPFRAWEEREAERKRLRSS